MLEAYVIEIKYLAMIFGTIMSLAIFIQTHKIWKRKSSNDVSLFTWTICFPGFTFWVLYGITISSLAIIIANIVALIAVTTVVIAWFIYKK